MEDVNTEGGYYLANHESLPNTPLSTKVSSTTDRNTTFLRIKLLLSSAEPSSSSVLRLHLQEGPTNNRNDTASCFLFPFLSFCELNHDTWMLEASFLCNRRPFALLSSFVHYRAINGSVLGVDCMSKLVKKCCLYSVDDTLQSESKQGSQTHEDCWGAIIAASAKHCYCSRGLGGGSATSSSAAGAGAGGGRARGAGTTATAAGAGSESGCVLFTAGEGLAEVLASEIIRVCCGALCLPFITFQGGQSLAIVGDVGGGASKAFAVKGERVLKDENQQIEDLWLSGGSAVGQSNDYNNSRGEEERQGQAVDLPHRMRCSQSDHFRKPRDKYSAEHDTTTGAGSCRR
jgi:hypothetical protein